MKLSLSLIAASIFTMLAACSDHEQSSDIGAQGGQLANANGVQESLKSSAVLRGMLTEGSTTKVAYKPEEYAPDTKPFIGVEVLPSAADATLPDLSITVTGAFPSTPRVVITDQDFNVLPGSAPTVEMDGDHVTLKMPAADSRRFVLVQDARWVTPMEFELSAALL